MWPGPVGKTSDQPSAVSGAPASMRAASMRATASSGSAKSCWFHRRPRCTGAAAISLSSRLRATVNGVPEEPEVAASCTAPCALGTARLRKAGPARCAAARVRIGRAANPASVSPPGRRSLKAASDTAQWGAWRAAWMISADACSSW